MRRMQAEGMDRVCVSTGAGNEPALALYQSLGLRVENWYLTYARDEG